MNKFEERINASISQVYGLQGGVDDKVHGHAATAMLALVRATRAHRSYRLGGEEYDHGNLAVCHDSIAAALVHIELMAEAWRASAVTEAPALPGEEAEVLQDLKAAIEKYDAYWVMKAVEAAQ